MIGGYNSFHYFPVGTVVYVKDIYREDAFDCMHESEPRSQFIKKSDLVVVE